jgi:general secretion pathway protein F
VALYSYEAAGSGGRVERGTISAPSRALAVERLLQQGHTPISLSEDVRPGWRDALAGFRDFSTLRARATLLRELSTLLNAGMNPERALATLSVLASSPAVRQRVDTVLEGLRGGEPLSKALAKEGSLFPETMRMLVAAGEASGRLSDVIARIAHAEMHARQLSDRLLSAMLYPALLLATMLGVLTLIFTHVLPQLEPVLSGSGAAMPWPAALLLGTSRFLQDFGAVIVVILVAGLGAGLYLLRQPAVQFARDRHAIKARYLLGIPLQYQTSQLCRNLGMLVDGGLPLNRALELAQKTLSNRFLQERLDAVIECVKEGRSLHVALGRAEVFPRIAIEFVAVGEETGRLAPMLAEAADMFDRDVLTRVERLSALLLPGVTIVLGLVVAAIMTGVVSGIFAANDMAFVP